VPGYDLVIVGAGSGNVLPDETMADWKIAIVEADRSGSRRRGIDSGLNAARRPRHRPGRQ